MPPSKSPPKRIASVVRHLLLSPYSLVDGCLLLLRWLALAPLMALVLALQWLGGRGAAHRLLMHAAIHSRSARPRNQKRARGHEDLAFYARAKISSLRHHDRFIDRRRGSERLLLLLAGHQQWCWPNIFERLRRFKPEDMDVCLCLSNLPEVPGQLLQIAERNGYSLLYNRWTHLSLIQNLAIAMHPRAQFIFKLDEDMLIPRGYFADMLRAWQRIEREGLYRPGLLTPLINVNTVLYAEFLRAIGRADDWRQRFGELRVNYNKPGAIYDDARTARYLWEQSLPFDDLAARVATDGHFALPMQFSIGAILFHRRLHDAMGGIPVRWRHWDKDGRGMGTDERELCNWCLTNNAPIVCTRSVFAGHLAYGPQGAAMRDFYQQNGALFAPPTDRRADTPMAAQA